MRVLVAEDDPLAKKSLHDMLTKWGYDVVSVEDGLSAWKELQSDNAPPIALIDRIMPGINGDEICRRVRNSERSARCYIILLTGMGSKQDIVDGLVAGGDDYVTKPFDPEELRARIHIGMRIVKLQTNLESRVKELEEALSNIKQLEELLPICACCKKIRDNENYWHQVETYISKHAGTKFSHCYCPTCYDKIMAEIEGND